MNRAIFNADDGELARFELVSAGLVNYLPQLAIDEHVSVFQELRKNQHLSVAEQDDCSLLDQLNFEGNVQEAMQQLKKTASIICTMHAGAYRLLNLFLIKKGIPFALVMGTKVLQEQGELFRSIFRLHGNDSHHKFTLIDAEQSRSGLQMLRALKEGKNLVLYLDGQTGAGDSTQLNKNNCIVNFMAQQLYARKGIAWLAHTAKCSILPVISCRKQNGTITFHFYSPIHSFEKEEREIFAQRATQQLYDYFGSVIGTEPGQWEGWLTIHQTAKIIVDTSLAQMKGNKNAKNLLLNSFRFGIFKTGGLPILFEKHRYLFYPVHRKLYNLLRDCSQSTIPVAELEGPLLHELLDKGIVIRV